MMVRPTLRAEEARTRNLAPSVAKPKEELARRTKSTAEFTLVFECLALLSRRTAVHLSAAIRLIWTIGFALPDSRT